MPRYRYVGAYPAILSDVVHGPGVTVERVAAAVAEGAEPEPLPVAPEEGATVVLLPGDVLTVDRDLIHGHLVLDGDAGDGPDSPEGGAAAGDGPGEGSEAGSGEPPAAPAAPRRRRAPADTDSGAAPAAAVPAE